MSGAAVAGRRRWIAGLAALGIAVVAVLAFGVFEVQTLFIDETVAEAGPVFASGASADAPSVASTAAGAPAAASTAPTPAADRANDPGGAAATPASIEPGPTTTVPAVREAARGTFTGVEHAGEGSVVLLTDGTQSFARFEDDFATENGPDLYVTVTAGGREIELGKLKGNVGAQNYELPAGLDPSAVERVSVWCKRFDATFTTAELA